MHIRLQHLIFAALVISLVSLAYGINYMWLTNIEMTSDSPRHPFASGDTLMGRIHSNSEIAIEGNPQFYGLVSSTASDFWRGPGYNPGFHGPLPQFRARPVEIPFTADNLRHGAGIQGTFYSMPHHCYRVYLRGDNAFVCRWYLGTPFDSTDSWTVPLVLRRCMFFEGPLEIQGHLTGQVSIGSSGDILILDNVRYDDADSITGDTPITSTNLLMLASEGSIKIANTPANGRWNSGGLGNAQTNRDSTDVVITAALYALGRSFTFEQQNDADSGYVYEDPIGTPHRDDRGTIYIYGGLVQQRRGFVHRSTNTSTGYALQLRYDERFAHMTAPCGFEFDEDQNRRTTDTLDFGGVPLGQTVWDTARIYTDTSILGSVVANAPFYATRTPPFEGDSFAIPVRFIPPRTGLFSGILYVSTTYDYYQIVLRGRGMPGGGPAPVSFDVSPNPFNLTTTLRFSLQNAGAVKITLYDVLGRAAKQMDLTGQEAGDHAVNLNAEGLASGVYFVRLQTENQTLTRKVLLLK